MSVAQREHQVSGMVGSRRFVEYRRVEGREMEDGAAAVTELRSS